MVSDTANLIWHKLIELHRWEQAHFPGAGSSGASEVLTWLLRTLDTPRPVSELYRSLTTSQPTLRRCLREFTDAGLATVVRDPRDTRRRVVRPTPQLRVLVDDYRQVLRRLMAESP